MTAAKAGGIARAGARVRQHYFSVDTGAMGMGCAAPAFASEQHVLTDSVALTQHPRKVPGEDLVVHALGVTTLLPWSTKILLNVELDDHAIMEERACGCPFETLGFTTHVRQIASYSKLTGEGVTLMGTDMIRVLEEVLPARFGGSWLDYQLTEEETADGFTRMVLRISPGVAIADEAAVRDAILDSITRLGVGADHGRALWQQAGTLRVQRAEPILTPRGKMMPLRLASLARGLRNSDRGTDDSRRESRAAASAVEERHS